MKTSSPTYLTSEFMAQFGWRAFDDRNYTFACEAHRLAKTILLYGVFPNLRSEKTMAERELLIREAKKHTSDIEYGSPLPLGEISIAMHSGACPRCSELARKEALKNELHRPRD